MHLIIGGRSLPLSLDTGNDDTLTLASKLAPIRFDFCFDNIQFVCRCEETDEGVAQFRLVGDAGPMPFTAESPKARNALQAIVEAANRELGHVFRVAEGRLLVGIDREVAQPLTGTSVVTVAANFLLKVRPYLILIAEVIRPPLLAGKKGDPAIRPEWRKPRVRAR